MKRLFAIVSRYTNLDADEIKETSHLIDDLGADSVTMMEIVGAIEAEYEIEDIPDDEFNEVKTVGDIQKLLCKYTLSI